MLRAWRSLLRLYPRSHRAIYGQEMARVFEQAAQHARERGRLDYVHFLLCEIAGLLGGSAREWLRALAHKHYTPQAASPQGGALTGLESAELRIKANLRRMEYAIAHHQFQQARFFAEVDCREREELARLMKQHNGS